MLTKLPDSDAQDRTNLHELIVLMPLVPRNPNIPFACRKVVDDIKLLEQELHQLLHTDTYAHLSIQERSNYFHLLIDCIARLKIKLEDQLYILAA